MWRFFSFERFTTRWRSATWNKNVINVLIHKYVLKIKYCTVMGKHVTVQDLRILADHEMCERNIDYKILPLQTM